MARTAGQQILQLERAQARAINHGGLRGALQMFDRGFVGFSSTQHKRLRGLAALRKTFVYYRKRAPKLLYHIEQPHVSVNGATPSPPFTGPCSLPVVVKSTVAAPTSSPNKAKTGASSTNTSPAPTDPAPAALVAQPLSAVCFLGEWPFLNFRATRAHGFLSLRKSGVRRVTLREDLTGGSGR